MVLIPPNCAPSRFTFPSKAWELISPRIASSPLLSSCGGDQQQLDEVVLPTYLESPVAGKLGLTTRSDSYG